MRGLQFLLCTGGLPPHHVSATYHGDDPVYYSLGFQPPPSVPLLSFLEAASFSPSVGPTQPSVLLLSDMITTNY